MIQIRRAELKDIPVIDELLSEVNLIHHNIRPDLFNVGRKYNDDQLRKILTDEKTPVFAAVNEEDRMVGYCMTQMEQITGDSIRTDIRTLYIDDLCVDEKVRGEHIGQKLFEYVKAYAKENGFYNVTLHVWTGNDSAAAFYKKMGFKSQFDCLEVIL